MNVPKWSCGHKERFQDTRRVLAMGARILLCTCISLFAHGCVSYAQPIFPDGVEQIAASMAARQQEFVKPSGDEASKIKALEEQSVAKLEADLADEYAATKLHEVDNLGCFAASASDGLFITRQAAYALARMSVLKRIYVGGCQRNMTGCHLSCVFARFSAPSTSRVFEVSCWLVACDGALLDARHGLARTQASSARTDRVRRPLMARSPFDSAPEKREPRAAKRRDSVRRNRCEPIVPCEFGGM